MAEIVKHAVAGTLESSDVFVEVDPNDSGLVIDIESVVLSQYGEEIRKSACEVLTAQGIANAKLSIVDRGALDCVIRARVETAIARGKGE